MIIFRAYSQPERDGYRIETAVKDPAESLPVTIDCYDLCAIKWQANELQTITIDYVRPTVANGFAYQCTTAGTTGSREPRWPTTLAQTVVDGSVTWTCVAASANGLNVLTSPTATPDTGLTVSNVAVSESTKITATYSSGTADQDYDVVYSFTLGGVTRIARQMVQVRKR